MRDLWLNNGENYGERFVKLGEKWRKKKTHRENMTKILTKEWRIFFKLVKYYE
jgi:hypothetical protein